MMTRGARWGEAKAGWPSTLGRSPRSPVQGSRGRCPGGGERRPGEWAGPGQATPCLYLRGTGRRARVRGGRNPRPAPARRHGTPQRPGTAPLSLARGSRDHEERSRPPGRRTGPPKRGRRPQVQLAAAGRWKSAPGPAEPLSRPDGHPGAIGAGSRVRGPGSRVRGAGCGCVWAPGTARVPMGRVPGRQVEIPVRRVLAGPLVPAATLGPGPVPSPKGLQSPPGGHRSRSAWVWVWGRLGGLRGGLRGCTGGEGLAHAGRGSFHEGVAVFPSFFTLPWSEPGDS